MAKEKKHGFNPDSTISILDSLKDIHENQLNEDTLPYHLLSPAIKKKRDDQNFFEKISYIIMIESIKIHQNFLAFMKEEKNKIAIEHEIFAENLLDSLKTTKIIIQRNNLATRLMEKLYFKLHKIEHKFKQILTYLNFHITRLNQFLEKQDNKIQQLEIKIDQERKHLADTWINHFIHHVKDPDFLPIRINISLPDKDKKFIEFNQDIFLQIGHRIGEKLRSMQTPIHDIPILIKQQIKNYLEEILSFVSQNEREKIIAELSSKLTIHIIQQLANDKEFTIGLTEICKQERFAIEEKLKFQISNQCLHDITKTEYFVRDKLDEITDVVQSSLNNPEEINDQLDRLISLSNTIMNETDSIFAKLDADLEDVNLTDINTFNLLTELNVSANSILANETLDPIEKDSLLSSSLDVIHEKSDNLLGSHPETEKENISATVEESQKTPQLEDATFKSKT